MIGLDLAQEIVDTAILFCKSSSDSSDWGKNIISNRILGLAFKGCQDNAQQKKNNLGTSTDKHREFLLEEEALKILYQK